MAKFCTQCGAKHDDDDLFCGVCGARLVKQDTDDHSAEKSEPSMETPEYEPVINQTTTASQNNIKKPPVFALIAVVVVVVALIICFMPKGSKNAVDNSDPSTHQSEEPASNKEETEFGLGTDPDIPVADNKVSESPEVNTSIANVSSDWGRAYFDVLADAMKEFPKYQYSCSYSVFDIDKDGTPELFLKAGTCEADYQLKLYRYANGSADCFATLGAGHAVFCGLGDQKAFLIAVGHMGYEVVTKYSYANGELNEEIIFEGAVQNYHEFSYLTSFELDDLSGLEWTANESDNNQSILDNYS